MLYPARALGAHKSEFGPEEIEVMRQAYQAACSELELDDPTDRIALSNIVLSLMGGRADLKPEALKDDSVLRFLWEKTKTVLRKEEET